MAEDPWSHQVGHLGHLEDINRTFSLQLMSQRRQHAECCRSDSTHTDQTKDAFTVNPTNITVLTVKHSEKGLQVMDHSGPIYGALAFHQRHHLKGIVDGPVRVWPAGGAVLFHLNNKIILKEKVLDVNPFLRPRTEFDAPECTYVF